MATFYKPHYWFKIMDYTGHYSKPSDNESVYKYLYIKICDKNREEDEQDYSFFISLEKLYVIRSGLSITIGNVNKEFTLPNYEKSDADESYNRLCGILGINH
jgi:hypothetical protein